MKDRHLTLKLTVLSPLHIGSGIVLDPTQYIVRSDRFYRIDDRRFAASLPAEQHAAFLAALASNDLKRIWQAVSSIFDPAKHAAYSAAIAPAIHKKFSEGLQRGETQLELHECVKEHGAMRPIIPGSSLKGALRTAILQSLLPSKIASQEFKNLLTQWKQSYTNKKGKKISFPDTVGSHDPPVVEGVLLNALSKGQKGLQFNIKQDPFRHLSVPDITLPADCLEIVIVERIKHATKDAGGPPVLLEAIRPGTSLSCSVSFSPEFLTATGCSSPRDLLAHLDNYTSQSLRRISDCCPHSVQQKIKSIERQRSLAQLGAYIGCYQHALHLEHGLNDEDIELPEPKTICIVHSRDGENIMGLVALTPVP